MENRYRAYCPQCNVALGNEVGYAIALGHAQQHARVTGHCLQVCEASTWTPVETVAGEPSLPLWE